MTDQERAKSIETIEKVMEAIEPWLHVLVITPAATREHYIAQHRHNAAKKLVELFERSEQE